MEAIKNIQGKLNVLDDKLRRFAAKAHKTQEATPTSESSRSLKIAEYDIHVLSSEIERECLIGLDGVLSHGDEEIKRARREQVLRAKELIDKCDQIRKSLLQLIDQLEREQDFDKQQPNTQEMAAKKEDEGQEVAEDLKVEDDEMEHEEDQEATEGAEDDADEEVKKDQIDGEDEGEEECEGDETDEEDKCDHAATWRIDFSHRRRRDGSLELIASLDGALADSISVTSSPVQQSKRRRQNAIRVRAFKPVSQCRGEHDFRLGSFGQLDQTFDFPLAYDVSKSSWSIDRRSAVLTITTPLRAAAPASCSFPPRAKSAQARLHRSGRSGMEEDRQGREGRGVARRGDFFGSGHHGYFFRRPQFPDFFMSRSPAFSPFVW